MKFVTPKELSNEFWTSLKTIYNHLNKHKGDIRTRKENWRTFVNFEDFKNLYTGGVQTYNSTYNQSPSKPTNNSFEDSEPSTSKLQKQIQKLEDNVTSLSKYNVNLEDQVSKYALLLTEEKNEKKEILTKFTNLQSEQTQRVEAFSKERLRRAKKYYVLLGISILLLLLLAVFVLTPLLYSGSYRPAW